jgi:hypothetical protein
MAEAICQEEATRGTSVTARLTRSMPKSVVA